MLSRRGDRAVKDRRWRTAADAVAVVRAVEDVVGRQHSSALAYNDRGVERNDERLFRL